MAIDKKSLQKLISRPEAFDPRDLEAEDEFKVPEEISEAVEEATDDESEESEVQPEVDDSSKMKIESSPEEYKLDPEIMEKLKRLKSGQSLEDSDEEEDQDIASDTSAPTDLRKQALLKIKQKYLGQ